MPRCLAQQQHDARSDLPVEHEAALAKLEALSDAQQATKGDEHCRGANLSICKLKQRERPVDGFPGKRNGLHRGMVSAKLCDDRGRRRALQSWVEALRGGYQAEGIGQKEGAVLQLLQQVVGTPSSSEGDTITCPAMQHCFKLTYPASYRAMVSWGILSKKKRPTLARAASNLSASEIIQERACKRGAQLAGS